MDPTAAGDRTGWPHVRVSMRNEERDFRLFEHGQRDAAEYRLTGSRMAEGAHDAVRCPPRAAARDQPMHRIVQRFVVRSVNHDPLIAQINGGAIDCWAAAMPTEFDHLDDFRFSQKRHRRAHGCNAGP